MKTIYNLKACECIKRLKKIDICIIDLDNCMLSGNSRVYFLIYILKHLIINISRANLLYFIKIILRTIKYILLLAKIRMLGKSRKRTGSLFIKILTDIPEKILNSALAGSNIHKYFREYVLEALGILPKNVTAGIISCSLDIILKALINKIAYKNKQLIDFFYSNNLTFYKQNGIFYCTGSPGNVQVLSPEDKLFYLKDIMKKNNKKNVLLIGHSIDEIEMAEFIKNTAGLSLGINPEKKYAGNFDIVLYAKNWRPVYDLFNKL